MLPAPHLGGSRAEQGPQSKAHTVEPRMAHINSYFGVFFRSAAAAAVRHYTWPSRLGTYGNHGTTAAALL